MQVKHVGETIKVLYKDALDQLRIYGGDDGYHPVIPPKGHAQFVVLLLSPLVEKDLVQRIWRRAQEGEWLQNGDAKLLKAAVTPGQMPEERGRSHGQQPQGDRQDVHSLVSEPSFHLRLLLLPGALVRRK